MLSLSQKFLFIHTPKTGGNSIQNILMPYSEDKIVAQAEQDGRERFEVRGRFTRHKHATLADYHERMPPALFADCFKFCAVRNPWSRAISFYFTPRRWMKRGLTPYWSRDEFLALLPQLQSMVDYLKIGGQVHAMDGLIRLERLGEQLPQVLERVGVAVDCSQLPHLNRSLAGDHRSYFEADPDLVDLVAERYREDIDYFGYSFDD